MHTDKCGNASEQECQQKNAEKILKYESLYTDVQRMRNIKCLI
jgi:hypothetical protein